MNTCLVYSHKKTEKDGRGVPTEMIHILYFDKNTRMKQCVWWKLLLDCLQFSARDSDTEIVKRQSSSNKAQFGRFYGWRLTWEEFKIMEKLYCSTKTRTKEKFCFIYSFKYIKNFCQVSYQLVGLYVMSNSLKLIF